MIIRQFSSKNLPFIIILLYTPTDGIRRNHTLEAKRILTQFQAMFESSDIQESEMPLFPAKVNPELTPEVRKRDYLHEKH